jgi:LysR family hydrogen peroxide-inducible transcriptional activator
LIEQAKGVLRESHKLDHLSKNRAPGPSGEFKLALIPTIAPYLLPLFLGSFAERYPNVTLTVEEMTTENILLALDQDRIDAGILATPLAQDNLIEDPLFYEPFWVFANPQHRFANLTAIDEDQLDAKDIWLLSEGHCLRNQIIRICSLRGKSGIFPNVRLESGSLETVIQLVECGHGYTLLPQLATKSVQSSKRGRLRPFARPVPSREVSIVWRRTQYKLEVIEALKKEVQLKLPADLPRERSKAIEVVKI